MHEERLFKPALIGGVLLGILSSLPLVNCLCCVWVIAGGILAAHLYVKQSPVSVTLGRGVSLGLLTGCIGTLVIALFSIPLQMLMTPGGGLVEQIRQSMNQLPNVPAETRQLFEELSTHAGIIYAFGFIFMLGFCSLFGMVGGAIGVALFEKRKSGNSDAPTPPYHPPEVVPPPPPPAPPTE
jgi:hypothetical protein